MSTQEIQTVFRVSKDRQSWFFLGSAGYLKGYGTYSNGHKHLDRVIQELAAMGITESTSGTDSMMNQLRYEKTFRLPGGYLLLRGGNCAGTGQKGAWIRGKAAGEWAARLLGLAAE
jgi:hypothetical protein